MTFYAQKSLAASDAAAQAGSTYPFRIVVPVRPPRVTRCQPSSRQRQITHAAAGDGGNGPRIPPPRETSSDDSGHHSFHQRSRALFYAILAASLLTVTQLRDRRRYNQWAAQHSTGSTQHRDDSPAAERTSECDAGAASADTDTRGRKTAAATAVIIPVLNEEGTLGDMFERLRSLQPPPAEIIFVDGGSSDRTCEMIRQQPGMRLVEGPRGRARQMNAGAAAATSGYLCFVHADTRPCRDLVSVIRYELASERTVAGGFVTRITHGGHILPWQTAHHLLKTFYMPLIMRPRGFVQGLRCVLGDQNIFLRRADFEAAGGYDEALPIMEDADLTIRMHELGTLLRPGKRAAVRHVMFRGNETSGRRMAAWGGLKATALHFRIGLMWLFGCTPQQLQHVYATLYTDDIRTPLPQAPPAPPAASVSLGGDRPAGGGASAGGA